VNEVFSIIGIIGAICFALSGLPQAIKSWKDGHSRGIATATVWLWLVGEAATLAYTYHKYPDDYILILNYLSNVILVGIVFKYKYWARNINE
jgi:uncharacterized protein with PQ loop repeat